MQPKRCIDWGDHVPAMKNFCLNCNTLSVHSFTLKVFVLIFSMLSLLLPYQHHTHTDAISAFLPRLLMSHRLTVPVTPTICKDLLINCRTKHWHPTFTGIYNTHLSRSWLSTTRYFFLFIFRLLDCSVLSSHGTVSSSRIISQPLLTTIEIS